MEFIMRDKRVPVLITYAISWEMIENTIIFKCFIK